MKLEQKSPKNHGISLLRFILAFMVVLDHFYEQKKQNKILHILYYHIPTFFLLSFFYTHNSFVPFKIMKIKLRFERIIIPYVCWSIISWVLFNIYFYIFKKECNHSVKELLYNFLNAHVFIPALWFQNIIILINLIFSIVILTFENDYLLIFQIIMILSYVFQYSGINYHFFRNHFHHFYYTTYGRLVETLPNSISGFFIAASNIHNKLRIRKTKTVIISLFVLLLATGSQFDKKLRGFQYAGVRLNIAAICIFFIFFYVFLDKIINKRIIKFIDFLIHYTAGIYYSHYLVGRSYFVNFILGKKIKTFFGTAIIYLFSYILCFFLDILIGKTKLKHLIK